jgi:hypothetical protein
MLTNTLEKVVTNYACEKCDFKCSKNSNWLCHLSTAKHLKTTENSIIHACELCDYKSVRRSDYDKHLLTSKHKKMTNVVNVTGKMPTDLNVVKLYECVCGKEYNHKQSLYTHKKVCTKKDELGITTQMFMELLKQNNELHHKILELSSNTQTINNNSNNNTTNNTKFNLSFFLHDQCKDAWNLSEFLDTLHITVADTERVGAEGFIEGITKIFLNGLNQLDIYKRPIHCSDLKRETMYVKENNTWTKEEKDSPTIVNAVKDIACKNVKSIPEWKKANPESRDSSSKKSDQYLKILKESLGACDKEKDLESYLRVAAKIAKGTTIPKGIC